MPRTIDAETGQVIENAPGLGAAESGVIFENGLYYDPTTNTYYAPGLQPGATPAQQAAGLAQAGSSPAGSATSGPGTVTITAAPRVPWWVWAALAAVGGWLLWQSTAKTRKGRVVRRVRPA